MNIWNGIYNVMYVGTNVDRVMYARVDVLNARIRLVVLLFEFFYHYVAGSYMKICKNWLQRHTHTSFIINFLEIPFALYTKGCMGNKAHVSIFLSLASDGCNIHAKSTPGAECYRNLQKLWP
jgi:hypothetical protein